ncbi:MAG: molybdopterin molybdotransferase MoeA [Actinomycetota bacterium]|nr:molybdopterin molybdotransferase MoeA [Actinomycetota bacterium]
MTGREFFTTRTVGEALAGFVPSRRTATQQITLADALRRVPAHDIVAPGPLPGFARSTVDGYAVQAADTYGASEGLPSYLDIIGAVRMGTAPEVTVAAGTAVEMPTGGVLPAGADAVVMVEYTNKAMPAVVEVLRPVAPGGGVVRADEDVAAGAVLVPAGRPLRAADLGMLAAAGVTEVVVHAQPRVAILSTGDEVVPPDTATLRPGQVRDAIASALAGLAIEAGGVPVPCGIVPDDLPALRGALQAALGQADLVVISAGSSVGARDATTDAVASLGKPGIFCHGLAVKPGKPTLLADCDGVPVIGLPGNPLSALVVFRLVGVPVVWRLAGCPAPPPEPSVMASLTRAVPSEAGRRDVVQVRFNDGRVEPLFGASALLSVLTRADGYLVVPEPATGLDAGSQVSITMYR